MKTIKLMGFIISAILMSKASGAEASVPICHEPSPTHSDPVNIWPEFEADSDNPQLARAWVDVEVQGDYVNADLWREEGHIKKKIDGLSMDPKSKDILFKTAKKTVTCATYSKGGSFSRDSYKATGQCKFSIKTEKANVDDGFKMKKRVFVVVDMVVES